MKLAFVILWMAATLTAAVRADGTFHAMYRGAASDLSSIAVTEGSAPEVSLPVTDPAVRAQLKDRFQFGDRLTITFTKGAVEQVGPETVSITDTDRILVLGGFLAVHLVFGFLLLGRNFKRLLIGHDNRYSNSKCQMVLWFGVLAITYLSATFLRWAASGYWPEFAGGVNMPKNLLLLSGLSVFSFGAAKGITANKQAAATAAEDAAAAGCPPAPCPPAPGAPLPPPPPPIKVPATQPQFVRDLLCDDAGNPDIGDYQMMAVTAMAIGVYLTQILGFLGSIQLMHQVTLPDVDSTILATFGLGQGAYLVKKHLGD